MVLICLKIFICRIIDVSLGTLRTMYIVKGNKIISSIIACAEVLIWYYAARTALVNYDNNFLIALFYALGYASGTYIGTFLNELFDYGIFNIQVVSSSINSKDILKIKKAHYGLSVIETADKKIMLFISLDKKRYQKCIKLIKSIDKDAFIVAYDAVSTVNGYFKNK